MIRTSRHVAALGLTLAAAFAGSAQAGVVISQVYGAGGNTGAAYQNDYVELHNTGGAAVDVGGWSVQYASATGTSWQVTNLAGVIPAGGYLLVREAAGAGAGLALPTPDVIGGIAMSGSAGKVALVNSTTALVGACPAGREDLVGFGSTANCFEGAGPTPVAVNNASVFARVDDCVDTDSNAADFASVTATPHNSSSLPHVCDGGSGIPGLVIADVSGAEGNTGTQQFAFTVSLSSAAGAGGVTFDWSTADGTAVAGEDYVAASGTVTIPEGSDHAQVLVQVDGDETTESDETFFVNVVNVSGATVADGQGKGTILNDDFPIVPISQVQGAGDVSPLAGQTVAMRGIVTGRTSRGFFLQSRDVDADADPNTSEGVYVFLNATPPAVAQPGRWLVVRGTVQEYIPSADLGQAPLTEISGAVTVFAQDETTYPLPEPVVLTADFPSPTGGLAQLERVESMRVRVPDFVATAPTDGNVAEASATATSTGLFFGTVAGVARPFREPGIQAPDAPPAGTIPPIPQWDFNPEILSVDSDGLLGMPAIDLAAGAHIANLTGPLNFSFRRYQILPDSTTGAVTPGPAPRAAMAAPADAFSIAGYNMERFFDDVDDAGISDVKLTAAALDRRLSKASLGIRDMLHTPDILAVVEMENIGVLTSIANRVNSEAAAATGVDPHYVPYLVEGNDVGGIDVGFLVKTGEVAAGVPRVSVTSVTQIGKAATYTAPDGSTSLLNDRPPLELDAVVHYADGRAFPVVVVAVHQRSLNGADTADAEGDRIRGKRQKQAEFLATYLDQRQHQAPDTRMVVLGDFNAFEFNDGLVDAMGTVTGKPSPDNETAVANDGADLVTPDFVNLTTVEPKSERYSFTFDGNAQSLDHVLVNEDMVVATRDIQVDHARINADFPEINRNDANSPSRLADHDPVVAYFVPRRVADLRITQVDVTHAPGEPTHVRAHLVNAGPEQADEPVMAFDLGLEAATADITAPAGWTCGTPAKAGGHTTVECGTGTFANGQEGDFTFSLVPDVYPDFRWPTLTIAVNSLSLDPQPADNTAGATLAVPGAADLRVAVSAPAIAKAGRTAAFGVTLRNVGTASAESAQVVIHGNVPPATVALAPANDWTCTAPAADEAGFVATCRVGAFGFAGGGQARIGLGIVAPSSPRTIRIQATAASLNVDPVTTNNSAASTLLVTGAR